MGADLYVADLYATNSIRGRWSYTIAIGGRAIRYKRIGAVGAQRAPTLDYIRKICIRRHTSFTYDFKD